MSVSVIPTCQSLHSAYHSNFVLHLMTQRHLQQVTTIQRIGITVLLPRPRPRHHVFIVIMMAQLQGKQQ